MDASSTVRRDGGPTEAGGLSRWMHPVFLSSAFHLITSCSFIHKVGSKCNITQEDFLTWEFLLWLELSARNDFHDLTDPGGRNYGGVLLTGLLSMACSALFLIQLWTT